MRDFVHNIWQKYQEANIDILKHTNCVIMTYMLWCRLSKWKQIALICSAHLRKLTQHYLIPWHYLGFNDCESQPCYNGGSCRNTASGYTCQCRNNYVGRRCQTYQPSGTHARPLLLIQLHGGRLVKSTISVPVAQCCWHGIGTWTCMNYWC